MYNDRIIIERLCNMNIRKATVGEFGLVRAFYHEMTDWLDTAPYGPGWKKDIYPSPEDISSALENGELWVCEENSKYIASMIVNSRSQEEYALVEWGVDATQDEVLLIHALGVLPQYHGRGIASEMVRHAITLAKSQNKKAMRLDVLSGNLPAEKLYPKFDFRLVSELDVFYEDTGLARYKLYELAL